MSNSSQLHGLQHARPPCPSSTPRVYSNSCPLSQWCIQPSHPLSSPSPPASIFPSINVFSNESALHIRWPKYWRFSFNICPSNDHPGLISFRMDYGSPRSLRDSQESSPTPQFKSINSSALSFLYSPTLTSIHDCWKTIALTRQTFVGKVMALLFNMLSRMVIVFLPRSKRLSISWLQSPSAEPKKIKSVTVSIISSLFAMKWWDWMSGF